MISSIPSNNTPSSGVEPITTTTSSMSLEFNPIIASSHNNTSRTQSSPQQPPSSPLSAAIDSNDKTTTTTDPINSNELSELLLGIYMRNAIQSSVKRKVEEIAMDKTTANALSFHYKKRQGLVRTDLEKKSINNTNGGALDGMVSTTTTTIPLLIQESISNDHSIVSTLNAPSTNLFCASSIHDLTTTTVIEKNTSSNTTSMLDNSRGNHDNSTSVSDDKKVPMAFSTMTNTDNNETDSETEAEKFTRTFMEDYVNDDLIVNKDEEANIVPVNVKDYVMDHFRKTILLEWDNYKRSTQFKYEWIETRIKHLQQEYNYILDLLQEKHSLIHSNSDQSSDNISETFNGDTFKPSTLLQETLLSPAKRRNDFMQHPFFSSFEEFFNRELEHFRQLKEKQSDLATISSHWLSAAAGGASSVVRQQVASDTNTMVDESVTSAVAPPSDMTTTTMPTTTTAAPTMMTSSSSNKPQAATTTTTTTTQLHSSMSALSPTASSLSIITLNLNCHPGSSLPLTSPQTSKIMYPLPYITSADILDSLQLIYNPNTSYSNYPLPRRTYPLSFSNIMNQYNKKKKRVGSSRRSTSIRSVAGFRRSRGAEDNPTEDIVIFDTGVSNIKDIKYKEIVTPSFRVLTNEELSQLPTINETEEEEDISDARYCYLHIDNEMQERQKYYLASLPTTDKKKKKSQADEEEEIRKTMKYQVPSYETIVEAFESFKSKRSEEQSSTTTTTTTEICHPKPPIHKFSENFTYLVPKDQMVSGSTSSSTCATPTSSKTTLMNAKLAYTSQSSTTSLTSPQKKQKDKKTADQSVIPRWKLITLESYVPYPISPCEDPRGNWEELKFKSRERMQSLSLSVDTPILNPTTTTTTMTLPSIEDDISRKRGVGQSSLLEEDEVMIETNDYDLASNTLNTETTLRTYASLNQSNSANRKRKKPPTSIDDDTLIALSEDDEDDVDYRDSLRKKSLNRDSDEDADDEDYIESRDRKKNKSSTTGSGYTSSHSRGKKRGPGRPKSTETTECTATSFVADRIYDTKIVLKLNGGGSVDTSSKEKKQSSSSNGKNKKHHK